jgi:hypothetical protein
MVSNDRETNQSMEYRPRRLRRSRPHSRRRPAQAGREGYRVRPQAGQRPGRGLARPCLGAWGHVGGLPCRPRGAIRFHRFRGHGEPGRRGRASLRAGRKTGGLVPRFQFRLARRQAPRRRADRRQRRPLCRRRGHDVDSALSHQGAPAARRRRRRRARAAAHRTRLQRQGCELGAWHRFGDQDVPQRDDQGA